MNEKNSEQLSVVMHLGLSHHYVITIPVKIFSNMPQGIERPFREKKE